MLAAPAQYFGELAGELARYAARPPKPVLLKIAALFHDVGKPQVRERRSRPDRYTFYYHEKVGLEIFAETARRLRLSAAEAKTVATLIRLHMRPFLLLPAFRERELTFRALGRLVCGGPLRAARPLCPGHGRQPGGQGPQKPADSDAVLADLADEAYRFLKDRLEPQERLPRLLNGHDLLRLGFCHRGPNSGDSSPRWRKPNGKAGCSTREEALKPGPAAGQGGRQIGASPGRAAILQF